MSYANGTTHYNLPQTVGTDKRDWFDTNTAFASVDAALYTASETASSAASDIVTLGGRVTDLETASGSQAQDIIDIKADILSQGGAITSLGNKIDRVEDDALDMICAVDEGTAQVATVPVNEGEFFRYNNVLYLATADIAIGDTIIPNTNCEATNVAIELTKPTVDTTARATANAVAEELSDKVEGTYSASTTYGDALNDLFSHIDLSKVGQATTMRRHGTGLDIVYQINIIGSNVLAFQHTEHNSTEGIQVDQATLRSTGSTYGVGLPGSAPTNLTTSALGSETTFTVLYR